jgi:hypothetical protein
MSFTEKYLCDKCKRNGKYNPGTGRSFCDTCYCGSHFDDTLTTTEVERLVKRITDNTIYGLSIVGDIPVNHPDYVTASLVPSVQPFFIKNVIFNDPATIVFWADGTKTVVKAVDEPFDKEKGLAMAICKKIFGNKGNYFNHIKKWTEKED